MLLIKVYTLADSYATVVSNIVADVTMTSEAKHIFITSINTDRYIESANDETFITSVPNRIYIR